MKQLKVLLALSLLVITITGCMQTIELHQPANEIVQIDLVYSPFGENRILYTLSSQDVSGFLNKLHELKLHKHTSPQDIGGSLFVRITYANESVELLGTASVGYLSNGVLVHDGWYYLTYDDLYALFSAYVDMSELLK